MTVSFARKVLGFSRKSPKPEPPAPDPLEDNGFHVAPARGKFGATATRWGVRALVAVLLVSGINQLVVKPLTAAEPAPVVTAPVVDPDQVRMEAARSAADYLTRHKLRADLVIPGAVTDVAVLVQARVGDLWLPLTVPPTGGPVFSPDLASSSVPAISGEDPKTTEATRTWAATFLTAYAASSTGTQYLTAPGVDLQGLSGAVKFSELVSWQLSAADSTGLRTGTAAVTWAIGAVTVQQTYEISITSRDGRWYALAISPSSTTTT